LAFLSPGNSTGEPRQAECKEELQLRIEDYFYMKRTVIAAVATATLFSANAFAGAATFSGAINSGADLSIIATDGLAADSATVLSTTLKVPGSKKDLLIGVSIESGVFTETQVKGKNGGTDLATASGSVDITVYLDGEEVAPGTVTFNHREQEMEATFGGVIDQCTVGDDGIIDVDVDCIVTDEMIRLLLDTTSANHFNFIAPNVGPGEHLIEVVADVTAAASFGNGSAKGNAVVNIGSLTVEVVRSANTADGITIE
jgi:hypothetical protein